MLSDKVRDRVILHVKSLTDEYHTAKLNGYNLQSLALPTFDSQEDFDRCRPEDEGKDFRKHNELTAEVLKGLIQNGIPAEPVLFHHAEFAKWLQGRSISQESRADFSTYLLEVEHKKKVA
jgi:hypothetical protein